MKQFSSLIIILGLIAFSISCTRNQEQVPEANVEGKIKTPDSLAQMDTSYAAVNDLAPNFDLLDSQGKRITLGDYTGKFVVLEWTDFACPYVRKHYESGNMQNLQKVYRAKGVVWLTICSSSPKEEGYYTGPELADTLSKLKWDGTEYLIDKNKKAAMLYRVSTTPEMYVINPQGILIYAGAIDDQANTDMKKIPYAKDYVAQALDDALLGNQVQVDSTPPYGCPINY